MHRTVLGAPRRLEEFDWVSIGIEQLDLLTAGTSDDVASEGDTRPAKCGDDRCEIVDGEHQSIPTARLLLLTVGHRPGP